MNEPVVVGGIEFISMDAAYHSYSATLNTIASIYEVGRDIVRRERRNARRRELYAIRRRLREYVG